MIRLNLLTKQCTKCGDKLPLHRFTKHKLGWMGLRSECRICGRKATSEYRKNNWLKCRAKLYQWREKNQERWKEMKRRSARRHPETEARNRKLHAEKARAKTREWQKKYPERVLLQCNKRRAIKVGAVGLYTIDGWLQKLAYHGGRCYYCKLIPRKVVMEHRIPLSRGGTNWLANLVPSCTSCNCSKHNKTEKEYREWLCRIAT